MAGNVEMKGTTVAHQPDVTYGSRMAVTTWKAKNATANSASVAVQLGSYEHRPRSPGRT